MTHTPTHRFALAVTEFVLVTAITVGTVTTPSAPAWSTVAVPVPLSHADTLAGTELNSPWIVDSRGIEWAYGKTLANEGNLVKRDPVSGSLTSVNLGLGDEGAIGAAYSPVSDIAVFSGIRTGQGNRMVTFNLATGARLSSKSLATAENSVKALAFNSSGTSYIVGTNTSPAKIIKFSSTSGAQELSVTLATGMNDVTAFLPNGVDQIAVVNSSPVKLVPVKVSTLTLSSATSLPAGTPALLEPVVIGSTAYFGSDTVPGVITAVDIPSRTVIGSATLGAGETGARRPTVDVATGTLYAVTATEGGPRIVSYTLAGLTRLGQIDLGHGPEPMGLSARSHRLVVRYAGSRGIDTLSVAPEPGAPSSVAVTELNQSLAVDWAPAESVEPVLRYIVTASDGTSETQCRASAPPCVITGLTNGVDYIVSVVAESLAGIGPEATATGNPLTVPTPPSDVSVVRGNGRAEVSWTIESDGGRAIRDFVATAEPGGQSCVTLVGSCVIEGLTNGVRHTVRVVARSSAGDSAPSDASAWFTPATMPAAPSIADVTAGESGVVVSWADPPDDGGEPVIAYVVTLRKDGAFISDLTTTEVAASLSGLESGTRYTIDIAARNAIGFGPATNGEFATLTPPPPPPPPVVDPPVVDPPVVEPPIVDPPVVDPPVVDPDEHTDPNGPTIPDYPPVTRVPGVPANLTVVASTRRRVTLEWTMSDPGTSPVLDFHVQTSRFKTRGFTTVADDVSDVARASVRITKRGTVYVRIVAVNEAGPSAASPPKRVIRR